MFFINHFVAASNLSHQSVCLELLGGGRGRGGKQKDRKEKTDKPERRTREKKDKPEIKTRI